MTRRVVITGVGPITACGVGLEPLWSAMTEGRTAIGRIDRFAEAGMPCPYAAELPADAFQVRKVVPKSYRKATKVMCRDIELAVGAAAAAVGDAGLITKGTDADVEPTVPPGRMGCHIGAGLIAADVEELTSALASSRGEPADDGTPQVDMDHWGRAGMQNLTPLWMLKYLPNMLACHVTIIHDCQGPSNTITCAEASSGLSLGESMRVIQRGAADVCLTGGAESKMNPMAFMRQQFAGRLASPGDNGSIEQLIRPFDPEATGTVVGEGGGILVAEAAEHAADRGARAYAEVAGFAASQSICPEAAGLTYDGEDHGLDAAITGAMDQAGIGPEAIDALLPFGSGIPSIDRAEDRAIHRVFGDRASTIPLITTTPIVGTCHAGNGAVGLAVAAAALRDQRLPARINTHGARDLDANSAPARSASLTNILVFSTSQGGQNAAVVLRRAES